ncbi:2-hydroxyacid dehydrogenase [Kushneria aurantia]|uniref:2-hydroxyacid dehydrogenase n=1 Tax=Kushneria aurantia TaxID=504092 RepID=A0ABV6G1U0_9GAMM|nr:D-glycerate dehydrogenase [Kushneria aurantia]
MSPRILTYGRLSDAQLAELREQFHVDAFDGPGDAERPEFREALGKAHALIGAGLNITSEMLDAAPDLTVIASISVGVDNYPVEELTRRGILLCNTPDVLTETTADTGFALIMASARRVVELAEYVKKGDWQAGIGAAQFGTDVHGKTLGMVGFGRIGQAVARRGALGFGMKILYANASPKPEIEKELGARRCELDELLQSADFVCTIVPLTADTRHLIGARELGLMRESAIFINIARGQVVDEAALIEALQEGRIRGAGLDVFDKEPLPADSPLPHMANVVALPHIGSATHETRNAMAQRAVDNVKRTLNGERPISPINAEVLSRRFT